MKQTQNATQNPVAFWIPAAEQFCLPPKEGGRPFAKSWRPLFASPAEKDAEISALLKQVSAYINLTTSLDARIAELQKDRAKWKEAVDALASEREANAMLTEQLESAIRQSQHERR